MLYCGENRVGGTVARHARKNFYLDVSHESVFVLIQLRIEKPVCGSNNARPKAQVRGQCLVWYGLFMHFCDSNDEITRMQREEQQ